MSSDLSNALLAALGWAAIDAARAHDGFPFISTFAVLFGSTSLVLGLLVVVVRRARPVGDVARAFITGALIAALPLALIAAVLERATHHRALGGVTFGFVALVVISASVACAARLGQVGRSGGPRAHIARIALSAVSALSCAGVAIALGLGLRAPAAAPFVTIVIDAAIGIASSALALSLRPRSGLPPRFGAAAWIVVVAMGTVVASSMGPLRHALGERAPVAFALGWGWDG